MYAPHLNCNIEFSLALEYLFRCRDGNKIVKSQKVIISVNNSTEHRKCGNTHSEERKKTL